MEFTLSFIFVVIGLLFFILGNVALGFARQRAKHSKALINAMYAEQIALLRTYIDLIKFAKTIQVPYDVNYKKEPKKPTIQ